MKKSLRVGIIGAGLIGAKRAEAIKETGRGKLVAIADVDAARAKAFVEKYGVEAAPSWRALVARKDIDAVIIAIPNAFEADIAIAALKSGKHIFCEKPFGINTKESKAIIAAAKKAKRIVKVGFNHRFHSAIIKAREIFEKGGIGKVLFIRARYGHGGRKGMEKEWRFNKKISGGGELLDQGVHVIDLARWFAGEFDTAYGTAETKFWNTKLDDNTFAILNNKRATAMFHVSTTQWKNLFSLEIFGDMGYLQVEGKGGSYGEETLFYGRKKLGFAPDIEEFRFGRDDKSWEREWENFANAVAGKGRLWGSAEDGLRANQIVEAIYASSEQHKEKAINHA